MDKLLICFILGIIIYIFIFIFINGNYNCKVLEGQSHQRAIDGYGSTSGTSAGIIEHELPGISTGMGMYHTINTRFPDTENGSPLARLLDDNAFLGDTGKYLTAYRISHNDPTIYAEAFNHIYPEKYVNDVAGYDNEYTKGNFYGFFDTMIHPISKRYLSEDYAFCQKWIDIGGDMWLDLTCNLTHIGSFDFKGSVYTSIKDSIVS